MADEPESNRKTILVLLGLLLVALAVRLVVFHNRQAIDFDETAYARMAENLVNGRGLYEISAKSTTHFTPLFSILIAGLSFVVKNFELAGRLVSLAAGLGLVIATYLLGKTLYDRRVGLVAAALVAVFPSLVDFSSKLYAESLYTFILVFGVLVGWLALTRRKPLLGLVAGLLFGLGYVARPEGFFYLPAFVIMFVLVVIFAQRKLDTSKAAALFVLGFMVFAIPYVVYLHSQLGYWTYSGKGSGPFWVAQLSLRYESVDFEKIAYGLTPDKHDINVLANSKRDDIIFSMFEDPVTRLKVAANQAQVLYSQQLFKIFPLWLLPLLGLGLFARPWDKSRLGREALLLVMLIPAAVIIASYVYERFFVPYMPFLLLWTALGIVRLEEWLRDSLKGRVAETSFWQRGVFKWLPVGLVALSLVPVAIAPGLRLTDAQKETAAYKDTGLWIRQNLGDHLKVMSRRAAVPYYADGTWLVLPYAGVDDILEYSRYQGVDSIVIDVRADLGWRPELQPLVDGSSVPKGIRKVGELSYGGGDRILIYAVEKG